MILIVDSGSTTTEWVFVNNNGETKRFLSSGFNPYYFKDENYLEQLDKQMTGEISFSDVSSIFFYGSGCSSQTNCALVKTSLWEMFPEADIHLNHDLYGSALALCGNDNGIACILGTGSNSCLWNGKEIIENVPSLGYLLGDEGSGTYLGKLILTKILLGNAPSEISQHFYRFYELDFYTTMERIYKQDQPNKFFAGISKFASDNISHPWIQEMIKLNFNSFIDKQVIKYTDYENHEISFVGSVAYSFQDILKGVLESRNLKSGKIIKSPIDELVKFHGGK
jgi:N-acetylglucosamine kinase-like BadF-type ATPase